MSEVIFSGNQPISIGNIPFLSNRDFDGSKIASSLPETLYPLLCKANARLCIAAPPIAIKCVLMYYASFLNASALSSCFNLFLYKSYNF